MLFYYVSLRLRQFIRFYRFSDIHPLIGIPATALLFIILSALLFGKAPFAEWLYFGLTAGAITELQSGKTNAYLRQVLSKNSFFKVKLAENLMLPLPFVAVMAWYQAWLQAVISAAMVIPYSWFSVKMPKPRLKALRTPFSPYAFEQNMAFRSVFLVYAGYLLLLVAGIVSQNFYVFLAPFFLLLLLTATATYGLPEEPYYIWVYRTSAKGFLLKKLKTLLVSFGITFLPFVLSGLIFYNDQLPLIILSVAVGLFSMMGCLFIKYHFYPGAIVIQISQLVFFGLTVACMVSPLMLVAVILFLLFSFFRAKANLQYILKC